jgi:predicted extracellular nuclease
MLPDDNAGKGTYFYSGNWNMLDNIVVSRSVLKGRGIYAEGAKGNIHSSEWMIFKNNSGDKTPNRSYVGNKYVGGVSDHFPVYFKLVVR